jgi:hypothetical protein
MSARCLLLLTVLALAAGCGTEVAMTTEPGETPDAMPPAVSDAPAPCSPYLANRLTVTTIDVTSDIRYKQPGYDLLPMDRRIALSVQPNGAGQVAWMDNALAAVHVTPISDTQIRLGDDTVVEGIDLAGLVAHDDGFALLTRRTDPGTPTRRSA